jgi:ribosomal protein S18 acetylase RimI-like enzyme
MKGAEGDVNLYSKLKLAERGLINEGKTLEGSWQELVRDSNGEWITLRNATEADYVQMSEIAINNFRYAPNYSYLQQPEGREQQEKYIAANSPDGIRDLCSKSNNVCNLVLEKDGKILGFRVVRKEDDVADGRRMHTSLSETGRGIGRILLRKSEKIAKQAGCKTMEVHATGNSYIWFEKYGFKDLGIRPNTISDYHLMVKEL